MKTKGKTQAVKACPTCDGSGRLYKAERGGRVDCWACAGSGEYKPQAAKPSPLPWVESDGTEIKDARGTLCAIASSFHLPHKEAIENRALIVRAVNAYSGLVRWLKAIANASPDSTVEGLKQGAREALRAAGEAV